MASPKPVGRGAINKELQKTSKGSVKVVRPETDYSRKGRNDFETLKTHNAASGSTAKFRARLINETNAAAKASGTSSAGTVKINSARVRTPRIAGGLMGGTGAGNWRNMFK